MGDTAGMGPENQPVTLYTSQRDEVVALLREQGTYHVRRRFIQEKYGDAVAPLFLAAYGWYSRQAAKRVPRPAGAESAVWAYLNREDVDTHEGAQILTLRVPAEEVLFFDMLEWSDILNFRYLGEEGRRAAFEAKLQAQGITDPSVLLTTPHYPMLKRELEASWQSLFRHDGEIKCGAEAPVAHIQAGLWQLRQEWIVDIA